MATISITPQGSVYLCKTPLENDYKNQLTFVNATAQQTYFASKVIKTETDYTYIKKDNIIKVGLPIDTIIDCNYLYYINTGFTTKYYYCFITNMEYINENCTAITIETDVWQTYQFEIVKKSCFVEREHVDDDTIGKHTVQENLKTGDFIVNNFSLLDEYANSTHVIIGVTKVPDDMYNIQGELVNNKIQARTSNYNGVFSGLTYFAFETPKDASQFVALMDLKGYADNIVNVFLCPVSMFTVVSPSTWDTYTFDEEIISLNIYLSFKYKIIPNTSDEVVLFNSKTITLNSTLDGYTPKNNKMFTKEFNYLYVTNNNGGDISYAYEDFKNNTPSFRGLGTISPGCSIRLTPLDYKKYDTTNTNYKNNLLPFGLIGGKYPTCSWRSDTYTNWITQQSINDNITLPKAVGFGASSVISPEATLATTASSFFEGMLTSMDKETIMPVVCKGTNAGDVTYSCGMNNFACYQMSCKYEYAKICDDYLSYYGYKVNAFKIPNITGRTYWNYVKTANCNFEGDIPQIYLNKIKEMFNNGVTFWHDTTKFLDYSQNNTIVS